MTYGTYRNTDHPNPMAEPRSPRRAYKQRLKLEREARELARVKAIVDRWDGMLNADETTPR
jgi:hypothetical protein